jgi:hypothetical protein
MRARLVSEAGTATSPPPPLKRLSIHAAKARRRAHVAFRLRERALDHGTLNLSTSTPASGTPP